MKTIKSILIAGAVIVSASVYAQTVPAPVPTPATPTQTQPIPATQPVPVTQQNSETFSKPQSTLNPTPVPLPQGTNIKDTIIPGKTRIINADSSKSRLMTDSTIMNKKGSGELDTTSMPKTGKGMKKRRD